jgi:hypothetical protein
MIRRGTRERLLGVLAFSRIPIRFAGLPTKHPLPALFMRPGNSVRSASSPGRITAAGNSLAVVARESGDFRNGARSMRMRLPARRVDAFMGK